MDSSKLDLHLLFHDDPELLALLEDTPAGAARESAETPPETVPDMRSGAEEPEDKHQPEIPDSPPAAETVSPEVPSEGAPARDPAMEELDQLLANAPDLSELDFLASDFNAEPPSQTDPLLAREMYIPADPLAHADLGDDGEPLVFEKATPFEEEDLSDQTVFDHPSPRRDWDTEAQPGGRPKDERPPDPAGEEPDSIPLSRSKRVTRIVFNVLFFLLCLSLVVGSAVFAFSNDPDKSFLGFRFFNVISTSMKPQPGGPSGGFDVDDIVVVKRVDAHTIDIGDVITFSTGEARDEYLTHRVREILTQADDLTGPSFITRGDASKTDDLLPVTSETLVGKVVMVLPQMGAVLKYIGEHLILFIVFLAALFAFGFLLRGLLLNRSRQKSYEDPANQSQIRDGSRMQ